jgi:hypothetical protein
VIGRWNEKGAARRDPFLRDRTLRNTPERDLARINHFSAAVRHCTKVYSFFFRRHMTDDQRRMVAEGWGLLR